VDSPPMTLSRAELRYGEVLVLAGDTGGELLITPV
jgi:hypothetical protein